jgi:hypothetical protein
MNVLQKSAAEIEIKEIRSIQFVWVDAHDWIDQALDHPCSLITARDVFHALLDGKMKLWGIYRFGILVGVFVTEIVSGSRGHGLNIVALGGKGMTDWIDDFDSCVTNLAKAYHCKFVAEMGREGWRRVLAPLGWIEAPSMMMKVL